jgi:hypothetical protein
MKGGRKRTDLERQIDKEFIEELYLKGYKLSAIAQKLSSEREYTISTEQISTDLEKIREEYKVKHLETIDSLKTKAIEELNLVKIEAWKGFELSKKERKEKILKKSNKPDSAGVQSTETESSIKTIESYGDKGFLNIIISCIEKQAKITGIEAPTKVDLGDFTINWDKETTDTDPNETDV